MNRLKRLAVNLAARNWAVLAVLFAAGFLAYGLAMDGKFLWDDDYLVGQNPFFKSPVFILEVFRHYLYLDSFAPYYRPVQNISYMLDYWLWFKNPFGYHLSNVCYHVLAAFLVFLLLKKILPTLTKPEEFGEKNARQEYAPVLAFFVSLLWVVHPIHNAAVAYIAGRADSIACVSALSAWLLYIRASESPRSPVKWTFQAAALLCFLIGLCAKEIAFIWMALFAFHLFVFNREKSLRQKTGALAAVAAVLCVYVFLRHLPTGGAPMAGDPTRSFAGRFILMLRALGDYTGLIFFPGDLHMDRVIFSTNAYKTAAIWEQSIRFEYLSILGTLVIVAFVCMALNKRLGRRLRIFSIVWFVLGFLPISNLFPLNAQSAEHWIYMPSIGFLLFLAGCVLALSEKFRTAAATVAAIAVIPLVMRTSARSYEWADNERFYVQTILAGGGSTRINLNLALVYSGRGDYVKSEKILRDIVRRFPDYMPARINLGINLRTQGKNKEAEALLNFDKATAELASKQFEHTWSAQLNLALMRYNDKQTQEALRILDETVRRSPDVWELRQAQIKILTEQSGAAAAIPGVEEYAQTHWWHYESHYALGRLLAISGQEENAVAVLRKAAWLDIRNAEPFNLIAKIRNEQKRYDEACTAIKQAIRRDPDQPSQYLFLSNILDELGRKQEAQAALQKAESLRDRANDNSKPL
jgi:tetratricopeptide (TPR) repeat protein